MKKLFSVGNSFDKLVPIEFFWNWEEYFLLLIIAKVRRISDFSFASSLFGRSLKTRDIMTLKWSKPALVSVGHNTGSFWMVDPTFEEKFQVCDPTKVQSAKNFRFLFKLESNHAKRPCVLTHRYQSRFWPLQSHDISRFEKSCMYRRREKNSEFLSIFAISHNTTASQFFF